MKNFNRKMGRMLSLLAAFALLGGSPTAWGHAGHDHDGPSISLPDVVAQVNGQDIHKDVILTSLKASIQKYKDRGMPLSGDQEKIAAKKLIENAIGRQLLLSQADAIGVKVSSSEVDVRLKEVKQGFKSEKAFQHKLKDENLTLDQYKKELEEDIRIDAVLEKELAGGISISDDQIQAYYDKNKSDYNSPEQRQARVMLIRVKEDGGAEAEKEAKETLDGLIREIKGGKTFEEIAKLHSQDTLASRGGNLGYFTKDKMFPPFSERAYKLKVGEISDVFRTKHGYQVLQLTDIKPAVSKSVEEAKEEIRAILVKREIKKRTPDYLTKLKRQAKIKLYF